MRSYGYGEEINNLAEEHNMTYLIISEPAYRAGNTLDLAWKYMDSAQVWVERG